MTEPGPRLPTKVLHVLSGAVGGAALSAISLMEAFADRGVASCVVCDDLGTELRGRLAQVTRGEVLYRPLYWWNRKNRAPAWRRPLIEARQLLRTGKGRGSAARVSAFALKAGADLIHTCTVMTPEGGHAARWLGLPHVWHVRELIGPGKPFRLPLEGPKLGEYFARHASKVVANSEATAECLRGWLPGELLEVVPNGLDLTPFAGSPGPRSGGPLVVGMVGAVGSRSKKHRLFIEAARAVKASDVEFRIYGGGARDAYVEELERAGAPLGARLRFMGPFDAPAPVMRELDVLVQPSDGESFGRVVVEAMASGVPVVGVRGGGALEIVADGQTGLLAAPDDAPGLAAHLDRLLGDAPLRERLGEAGRRRAQERYSMTACADGIERVYRAAMAAPVGAAKRGAA